MSPLRMRMIEDMKLAGLSPGTQATYIDAVRKLAAHYRRSPDQLSEEEVRAYILNLREGGAARGTFKANYYGIQYLYRYTVNRDWALFTKKTFVCRNRSGYPTHSPTPRFAGCLPANPGRFTIATQDTHSAEYLLYSGQFIYVIELVNDARVRAEACFERTPSGRLFELLTVFRGVITWHVEDQCDVVHVWERLVRHRK